MASTHFWHLLVIICAATAAPNKEKLRIVEYIVLTTFSNITAHLHEITKESTDTNDILERKLDNILATIMETYPVEALKKQRLW
ncbi:hypothetical protein PRIPAC_76611 [Pristionchus pacificus]|uniref:Uncharacterized protein n=1 Tax=Pristionchus pacificus TaxID=54126 RepID=A0A2A6C5Z0_PRIPA|nr:hypothetical protein PRIPAC_76356 [Pristionchus pacificus]KAF8387469.1 hypothetical protein PRIPAC_76611 [Pristionchus pacificus]|eukprot:PDM63938.1 hypothetical protein PRIPAC_53912 [Pristionchus pacificus]